MMDILQTRLHSRFGWRPSPLLVGSMLLHGLAAGFLVMHPAAWPIVAGILVGNHALLALIGLLPRSALLGPNWTRLPAAAARRGEVALTIDDGPDPRVTPMVLDILDRYGVRATFFCVGDEAQRHPDLCRDIVRRGHAVENHSQSHTPLFAALGPRRIALDVDRGQRTLQGITGESPRFFRPIAGLRSVFLDPVLARQGLVLVTWTRRAFDTRESRPEVVLERLVSNLAGGDILLLHDGNAARTTAGIPVIVAVLPRLLDRILGAGLLPVTLRSTLQ
jgi:peptidoglycan/xylan/chitin deacetylase (PgdA/CDA1 family)